MAPRLQRGRLRLVEPSHRPTTEGDEVAATEAPDPRAEAKRPPETSRVPKGSRSALADVPDAQLVGLGAEGDVQALEILYRRHAAFAINLATRIEGSPRDVEDIVHDAFLRAFERLRDLTDRSAFRGWLGSIVVHAVRSRMRRGKLLNLLGLGRASEPVDLDALTSPEASPHVRAQLAQIYALLRTLPADERIAWTLRCIEGHELEAVAGLTRCSLATVKRRITRAQRFLDEHFVDPTGKEDPVSKEVCR
ncbi:RNA polymerase sigma factor [Polyangium sp. 6x1]|uniref:RNA polymerase sigma factor n=1 Tax=Polyangium sp. 6x1 TaxID=3042689 RepID=UPI0024824520|nr:RNA polymerase sigma factor [Polyangium sp. 6x1]MDI1450602.1 RNA polymerase sigma factor [Polyangium sp. 6x1]